MNITKSDVLTLALLLSLGLNIYEIMQLCPGYCNDIDRYSPREQGGGGKDVQQVWAKEHIDRYREIHRTDGSMYKTTGFKLSKRVCDYIFEKPSLNGISLDLIENDDRTLALVINGLVTENTQIDCSENSNIFINQSMCPADCFQY